MAAFVALAMVDATAVVTMAAAVVADAVDHSPAAAVEMTSFVVEDALNSYAVDALGKCCTSVAIVLARMGLPLAVELFALDVAEPVDQTFRQIKANRAQTPKCNMLISNGFTNRCGTGRQWLRSL